MAQGTRRQAMIMPHCGQGLHSRESLQCMDVHARALHAPAVMQHSKGARSARLTCQDDSKFEHAAAELGSSGEADVHWQRQRSSLAAAL